MKLFGTLKTNKQKTSTKQEVEKLQEIWLVYKKVKDNGNT